jgi:hypothetical protein
MTILIFLIGLVWLSPEAYQKTVSMREVMSEQMRGGSMPPFDTPQMLDLLTVDACDVKAIAQY